MRDSRPVVGSLIALALLGPAAVVIGSPADSGPVAVPATRPRRSRPSARRRPRPEARRRHPLDPLEPRGDPARGRDPPGRRTLAETYKFVSVALNEPAKALVLHPEAGAAIPREARLVLLDRATGTGYEALVNLSAAVGAPVRGAARRASSRRS